MGIAIVLLVIVGFIGAFFSLKSAQGWSWVWPFGSGLLAIGVWVWMTKQPIKPWVAAVTFDGVYGLAWLLALAALGEKPGAYQIIGGLMVLAGLFLAGIES
jgi:drug/metabolite transporter (DMT)-like permease